MAPFMAKAASQPGRLPPILAHLVDAVVAQVGHKQPAVGGVKHDAVRVGAVLAVGHVVLLGGAGGGVARPGEQRVSGGGKGGGGSGCCGAARARPLGARLLGSAPQKLPHPPRG